MPQCKKLQINYRYADKKINDKNFLQSKFDLIAES